MKTLLTLLLLLSPLTLLAAQPRVNGVEVVRANNGVATNLAIGTNSPAGMLHVHGTIYANALGSNSSVVSFIGRRSDGQVVETATVSGSVATATNAIGNDNGTGTNTTIKNLAVKDGFISTNTASGQFTQVSGDSAGIESSALDDSAAFGWHAGYRSTNAPQSTFFGYGAGSGLTAANANGSQAVSAFGWNSFRNATEMSSAVGVGYQTFDGASLCQSAVGIGVHNFQGATNCPYTVAVGYYIGEGFSGAGYGVWLGGKSGTNAAYKLWIDGYRGVNTETVPLLYGDFLDRYLFVNGRLIVTNRVNIGTNADATTHALQVVGNARVNAVDFPAPGIVSNVASLKYVIQIPPITASNILVTANTNEYELVGLTNVVVTNIVEEASGIGGSVVLTIRNTLSGSIPIVLPAFGAQHGYYFHTNGLNDILSASVAPPGTNTVLSLKIQGSNVYPSVTYWRHP